MNNIQGNKSKSSHNTYYHAHVCGPTDSDDAKSTSMTSFIRCSAFKLQYRSPSLLLIRLSQTPSLYLRPGFH